MLKIWITFGLLNVCRSGISDLVRHFMRCASAGIYTLSQCKCSIKSIKRLSRHSCGHKDGQTYGWTARWLASRMHVCTAGHWPFQDSPWRVVGNNNTYSSRSQLRVMALQPLLLLQVFTIHCTTDCWTMSLLLKMHPFNWLRSYISEVIMFP